MTSQILVCTSCHGAERAAGLMAKLQAALGDSFQVGGVACMSGCTRPSVVAFRASGKASYLFGQIDPNAPIDDLIAFAALYAELPDGWITDARGLGSLRMSAIARIPVGPDLP